MLKCIQIFFPKLITRLINELPCKKTHIYRWMETQTHTQTDPDEYPIAVFAKHNYSQTSLIRQCLFLTVLLWIARFMDCQISFNITGNYNGYVVIITLYNIIKPFHA